MLFHLFNKWNSPFTKGQFQVCSLEQQPCECKSPVNCYRGFFSSVVAQATDYRPASIIGQVVHGIFYGKYPSIDLSPAHHVDNNLVVSRQCTMVRVQYCSRHQDLLHSTDKASIRLQYSTSCRIYPLFIYFGSQNDASVSWCAIFTAPWDFTTRNCL